MSDFKYDPHPYDGHCFCPSCMSIRKDESGAFTKAIVVGFVIGFILTAIAAPGHEGAGVVGWIGGSWLAYQGLKPSRSWRKPEEG